MRSPKPAKTRPRALLLASREVPLTLRKVRGARHLTLHWRPVTKDALLTMPHHVSMASAMAFVESRKKWLEEQIESHGPPVPFADGAIIPLLGQQYTVRHAPAARGTVRREEGAIIVCGAAEFLPRRLTDWLVAYARSEIEPLAHAKAVQLGKKIRRLSLRDTVSHWGSCMASGSISFSWRLVFAPREVMEYVVCHEVAHLAELNHSQRFWDIVEELYPGHEAARDWLSQHGHTLYAYG